MQNLTLQEMVNVFSPTTPNPTSGFLFFVARKELVFLDMSIEEAVKMVISGGIAMPPDRRPAAEQDVALISADTYESVGLMRKKEARKAPFIQSVD